MSDLKVVADPDTHDIVITRSFDAPLKLVFKAYTDPEAVPQWWGQSASETVVDELEAQAGGRWRLEKDADGNDWGFHGVYHETVAPERIVNTFEFEGMPGHVLLETTTFEDQGGRTLMTSLSVFPVGRRPRRDAPVRDGERGRRVLRPPRPVPGQGPMTEASAVAPVRRPGPVVAVPTPVRLVVGQLIRPKCTIPPGIGFISMWGGTC